MTLSVISPKVFTNYGVAISVTGVAQVCTFAASQNVGLSSHLRLGEGRFITREAVTNCMPAVSGQVRGPDTDHSPGNIGMQFSTCLHGLHVIKFETR